MDIHPPFSEQEKRFVLAEAIKLSSIPVDRLLALLSDGNVQPAWPQMLLPYGRNLQSCIDTFEVLRAGHGQPSPYSALPLPNPSHKRKSAPESLEPLMTGPQPKRRQSGVETVPSARDIRPKPTSSNGSPHPFSALPGQPAAPAKKRGRPSKADVEERNREAIARGEVLPPPKAVTPKGGKQPVTGEPSSAGYAAIAPMGTAPPEQMGGVQYQGGPVEAGMTAAAAPAAPGDSPGKKKRARPAPRQPKVPKPGESSFSIATPQMTQPQPMEAPQVQTPITPSQAFAQQRPAESVPISQLVQPTPTESRGQPPPEPPSQPEPPQPSA